MAGQKNAAPIVIKRKKVIAGGGHHGGAWKVAYADFVTAMMAFFMLMWLLNATTEKQRKGLADYFDPTITVSRVSGGGTGMFGGDSVLTEDQRAENGMGAPVSVPTDAAQPADPATDVAEEELLQTLKQLRESIKATQGQVRQLMLSARASLAAKDFTAAKTAVEQSTTVLESRIALKQQVNTALKELVTLLG